MGQAQEGVKVFRMFDDKTWRRAYHQTEKDKAARKAYKQTSKYKAWQAAYIKSYKKTKHGRERLHLAQKKYYGAGKGKGYATKWREEHKDYLNTYMRKYFKTPKGKAIVANINSKRRTITRTGDLTPAQWLEIKYRSPMCPMCGRFVECDKLSLDHIISLKRLGLHTKSNVQALCRSCNSKKGARI
jgi:5-methylcytosine-specific restriction endonuclease McrA